MVHLVLVDDNLTLQKVVELSFAEDDIEVHSFAEGESALEYLRSEPADVLLADVSGSLLDGYDLCGKVKLNSRTAHIPVVLLAGTLHPIDPERAKQVGCDGSLIKPFETSEMVDLVKKLLDKSLSHEMVWQSEPGPGFEKVSTEEDPLRVPAGKGKQLTSFPLMLGQLGPVFAPLGRDVEHLPRPEAVEPGSEPSLSQFRTPVSVGQERVKLDALEGLDRLSPLVDDLEKIFRTLESYAGPLRRDSNHLQRDLEGAAEAIQKVSRRIKEVARGLDRSAEAIESASGTAGRIHAGAKGVEDLARQVQDAIESLG